jgi:hypothetical protein
VPVHSVRSDHTVRSVHSVDFGAGAVRIVGIIGRLKLNIVKQSLHL